MFKTGVITSLFFGTCAKKECFVIYSRIEFLKVSANTCTCNGLGNTVAGK